MTKCFSRGHKNVIRKYYIGGEGVGFSINVLFMTKFEVFIFTFEVL